MSTDPLGIDEKKMCSETAVGLLSFNFNYL